MPGQPTLSEKVEAVGASVFSLKSDVQNINTSIEQIYSCLACVETNVKSVADLLHEFVTSVNDLRGAFEKAQGGSQQPDNAGCARKKPEEVGHERSPDDVGRAQKKPEDAGRARKAQDAWREWSPNDVGVEPDMDKTIVGDDEPSLKASTVAPPGGPQSDVQASSGGEEASSDEAVVIVKMKASGPAASRLSPRRPQKASKSPLTTVPSFFSGEETEEEEASCRARWPVALQYLQRLDFQESGCLRQALEPSP